MTKLETGYYYHIYNHANGHEDIFREEKNYTYFLEKYRKYIHPVAETFAYCLMKNHFHFFVRIRDLDEIGYYQKLNSARFVTTQDLSDCEATDRVGIGPKSPDPTRHLSHLFNTYSKYFNKTYQRKGSLDKNKN